VRVGVVGLPNAGKTTLFNALAHAGAEVASYPFTTVDPNVAVVPVRDERLDRVAVAVGASPLVYETLAVHDVAGLVRGAHAGEGLGNRFLANIRETDAILHVVRAHGDPDVPHPDGAVDPVRDAEAVEAELALADLEQAERRLERVGRQAKSGDRAALAEEAWLGEVTAALGAGRAVRSVPPPSDAPEAVESLQPLTAKPVLYVANVADEGPDQVPAELSLHAERRGAPAVALRARIESELAELDDPDAETMRQELELSEDGVRGLVAAAFALLGLVSFFTADRDTEARAHAVSSGTTAWEAAGKVHTDMQRGFVRAEVTAWDELVATGGYGGARERGTLRLEGRDYQVADGDVLRIRFS
jgi:GTP-binding protein YchF